MNLNSEYKKDYDKAFKKDFKNLLRKAEKLATRHHGLQEYNGLPYDEHLQEVVNILERFGYDGKYLLAGWLHDILEDCAISYNDIKKLFGEEIAEIVYDVTDEMGRNRKERKSKTYPKIRNNPDAIIVKLADRIANMESSMKTKHGMIGAYQKEYEAFKYQLQVPEHATPMWNHLDELFKDITVAT